MKIVYCIAGTYNSGGMERVLSNKANYLTNLGHEIIIVTTEQRGRAAFFRFDERIRFYDLNINYEENNGRSLLNKAINYPVKQIRHRYKLVNLLKKLQADIVVSMFCNEASFLAGIKDGSKKILEVHFSRYKRLQYGRKGLWRLADKIRSANDLKVCQRYDRFVVLTNEDKEYWGDLDNIRVIPNARSFTFDKPAELLGKRVIAVGRFNFQKGYDRLIKAWEIVCKKVTNATLTILGEGELKENIQELVDKLNLSDSVSLGNATEDIKKIYQNSSILVMTSHYEGLPMVLLEAQAAGLPIVSFACKCGPRDVIDDGLSGFLVEDGDIQSLADRIVTLLADYSLRRKMGANAYHNSSNYDEVYVMDKWIELFNSLV